jgi:hypothetical protein
MVRIVKGDSGCGRDCVFDELSGSLLHADDGSFHRVLKTGLSSEFDLAFDEVADSAIVFPATASGAPDFVAYLVRSRVFAASEEGRPICFLCLHCDTEDTTLAKVRCILRNIGSVFEKVANHSERARGFLYTPLMLRGIVVNPCVTCSPLVFDRIVRETGFAGSDSVASAPVVIAPPCDSC